MRGATRFPGFFEGVAVAAVLSVTGGALEMLPRLLIPPPIGHGLAAGDARPFAILTVSFCYLLYLLWRSPETAGRISVTMLWVGISLPVLLLAPHWILAVQLVLLWLTRMLFLQRSLSAALADLVLLMVGLGAGFWAIASTASLAAAIWTFLLVQAPFAALGNLMPAANPDHADPIDDDHFERAERNATASLRRLVSAARRG
ncbi:MAG TPA: hypothetical protein DDY14_08970 [Chromatiaceae bacterium]|jgi:hypothetical protein|nr:MAG: hypothetical protein N838_13065 [Thiohalocapsa sp. PB-PSB1]QQO54537.1 MAG: hypothetical protein N838_15505 [Thiohalocapsa sp. PB-PSB1]HBG95437.1 hypothetical protein [Chromatiaceae bacterium]HCS89491.1 hypothetical protein [Chromatiaceae bacterium]